MNYTENDMERGLDAMREMFCPECNSNHVAHKHHKGDMRAPECDYKVCEDCGHQWGYE